MNKIRVQKFFDVQSYLTTKGIRFDTEGENVSQGWIGLNCIFCSDLLNHLGINLEKKYYSCWNCGETGDMISLVKNIEGCTYPRAVEIAERYLTYDAPVIRKKRKRRKGGLVLPDSELITLENINKRGMRLVRNFLKERKFPESVVTKYDLHFCKYGDYPLSIIIPVYEDGELVSYQSLDITGQRKIKYLSEESIRDHVYNIDNIHRQKVVYLCEGVTDVWNVGDGALGFFSKSITVKQLEILVDRVPTETAVVIVFDSDAMVTARKTYNKVVSFYNNVRLVRLTEEEGDPGSLSPLQVEELRRL